MNTLYMTRKEIIDDLSKAFRDQNDLEELSDNDLAAAWIRHGIHAGTESWDDVCVDRLYYNAEMRTIDMLSIFRDWQSAEEEDIDVFGQRSREDFDAWAGEHLTRIEYFADYSIDEIIETFSEKDEKFLVVELDSENTPDFPYIPAQVWNGVEAYNDLFLEIQSGQEMMLAAAIIQLKLLRGYPIPELGYHGHGFTGWDGRIIRIG
jgi:hypothetical protein